MAKKGFKESPALAFIRPQGKEQEDTQQDTHFNTQENTLDNTYDEVPIIRREYVRTQGRKGHKKPRINLAFDSDDFLAKIRKQADKEGKSITQFVNDAVALYLRQVKK